MVSAWDGDIDLHGAPPSGSRNNVEVDGLGLNGTVPPILGHLSFPYLWHLFLGDEWAPSPAADQNKLTGPIPPELGIPRRMIALSLANTNVSGPIPRELALPRLLEVQENVHHSRSQSRLYYLYLYNTNVSGRIPPELGNLSFRTLHLFGNKLTGHVPWQLAKNVPGPVRVRGHTQYGHQALHLHGNRLTGNTPWQLGRLGKIQSLSLHGNRLTGSIPWQLGTVGSRVHQSDAHPSNSLLTGPSGQFHSPPWQLGLSNRGYGSHQGLGQSNPGVGLFLSDNRLTGPIPPQLSNIDNARVLDLSGNRLTGPIPWELGNTQATKFRGLYLHCNDLSGAAPVTLGEVPGLVHLRLHGNPRLETDEGARPGNLDREGLTVTWTGGCEQAPPPPPPPPTPPPPTDQPPVLDGSAAVSYAEDRTGPVATYTATDPERQTITWSLSGDDEGDFTIAGGVLAFAAIPDYEAPADADTDNVYEVTVTASDPSGLSDSIDVTITVTDVDEKPTWGDGVPDGEIIAQTEGRTEIDLDNDRTTTPNDLATFVASDPEGTEVTLSLRGPDADAFELAADTDTTNAVSQVLSFKHATDFHMPADSNGDNVYEVTVRASDELRRTDPSYNAPWWNAELTLIIRVVGRSTLDEWTPTLRPKDLGDGRLGCHNGVSGAECSAALTPDRFTVTRIIDGQFSTTVHIVEELYLTSEGELVLTMGPFVPRGFTLSTAQPGTEAKFSIGLATSHQARWRNTGLEWSAGRGVELSMDRPLATVSSPTIRVHYDGDPEVDGFRQWQPARLASYGYGVRLPGVFSYLDPNNEVRFAHTTYAKLAVFPEFQGSTVRVSKITYSATDDSDSGADPPVACTLHSSTRYQCVAFRAVPFAQLSHAIELNAHVPNTGVYIEVTDGSVVKTYFLDIDPPPRTYSLSPSASVVEGQDARLTLSLSEEAPEAGLEFTVTATYGTAGSADVGTITSPVTVPGRATRLNISVPTVDDDLDEDDESFTVTVVPVRAGWAVSPTGTGTATVTIEDNDDAGETEDNKYVDLIARMYEWRDDPERSSHQPHVVRWDRALLAFGEEVEDKTLTPMPASEAQGYADRGWTRWVEVAQALREIEAAAQEEEEQADPPANRAPTVATAIGDATIVNETGTRQVSLSGVFSDADGDSLTVTAVSSKSGVFSDADGDSLTVTAVSSNSAVATVSVSADYSSLTVNAQARGTATVTVTADDGNGGTVSDSFTVRVKAAPVVAWAIGDVSGLEAGASQDISLSGVFSDADGDADGDALTITAGSSNSAIATVTVAADRTRLTVEGVAQGTATITVTAEDSDGNRVSESFQVEVVKAPEPEEEETTGGAPIVVSPLPDLSFEGRGHREISLAGVFQDPDGQELTYDVDSSDYGVVRAWKSGDSHLALLLLGNGTVTVTVTARDPDGNEVSDSFVVTVTPAG